MIDRKRVHQHIYAFVLVTALGIGCKGDKANGQGPANPPPAVRSDVEAWVTRPDRFALFAKQTTPLVFKDTSNAWPTIEVDTTITYQEMDGFGYTLTGGSATLINSLPAATQDALLKELFLTDSTFIGISYLRVSIGASDLSASSFTYDDMPDGQTDVELKQFNINKEKTDLLPILKKIVALNPKIKILGSPWSAPTWMKTNNAFKGGSLKPEYYSVYAQYFVKYIQVMKAEGITIDAITIQNEPLHGGNVPSMVMQSAEQGSFIKNHLGPAFKAAGITTKIILYDHNADRPDYPMDILADAEAAKYVDGSAFHLYGGPITALTQVHDAYPNKHVYFTEQWVGGPGNFGEDLKWHISTLIIGATRNWSRNVLEWNLAADPDYKPHTDGGCTSCLGALTISSGGGVIRNVAYYIIAHAAKFVRPGSVRIASNIDGGMQNVAFKTPDGKKVLIVINTGNVPLSFNIKYRGKIVTASLNNGAVGTYVW